MTTGVQHLWSLTLQRIAVTVSAILKVGGFQPKVAQGLCPATVVFLTTSWLTSLLKFYIRKNLYTSFYQLLNISILPAFYVCRLKLSLTQQRITFAESQLQSNWKSLSQHPIPDWELCSLGSKAVVSYYQKKIRIHYFLIITHLIELLL